MKTVVKHFVLRFELVQKDESEKIILQQQMLPTNLIQRLFICFEIHNYLLIRNRESAGSFLSALL